MLSPLVALAFLGEPDMDDHDDTLCDQKGPMSRCYMSHTM